MNQVTDDIERAPGLSALRCVNQLGREPGEHGAKGGGGALEGRYNGVDVDRAHDPSTTSSRISSIAARKISRSSRRVR